jgi:lipoyl(octanoyl) transferase
LRGLGEIVTKSDFQHPSNVFCCLGDPGFFSTVVLFFPFSGFLTFPVQLTYMTSRELVVRRLGRVDYGEGLAIQKETERAVQLGTAPDTLILLEHPHTLTLGRGAKKTGILATEDTLRERGVTVFDTNRGGKVTYHGLGQLVGYPIINLSPDREDVHRYVRDLEEALIRTMADFEIEAFRIKGLTGVHTAHGKVAAIGVHIARWVTTHGFALNVNTDLSYFNMIIACEGEPVTSMSRIHGHDLDLAEVEESVISNFTAVFDEHVDYSNEAIVFNFAH